MTDFPVEIYGAVGANNYKYKLKYKTCLLDRQLFWVWSKKGVKIPWFLVLINLDDVQKCVIKTITKNPRRNMTTDRLSPVLFA